MKRITALLCAVALCAAAAPEAAAQDPVPAPPPPAKDTLQVGDWVNKTKIGIALTQSSFTRNWQGDEVGTVSWLALFDFYSDGQWTPKLRLSNTLVLNFGQTHQQSESRDQWLAPLKSADKIDYDGLLRVTLHRWVDPFVAVTLDSQFYQRVAGETKLFNPVLVSESAGIARAFWDTQSRSVVTRLGFALRQRYDQFAVAPIERTEHDGGFEWRTIARLASAEDQTVFRSELSLFQAVFFSAEEEEFAVFGEHRWKTIDVRWQNTLSNKLNEWMTFELYMDYVFNEQIDKAGQFRETMGIGITVHL